MHGRPLGVPHLAWQAFKFARPGLAGLEVCHTRLSRLHTLLHLRDSLSGTNYEAPAICMAKGIRELIAADIRRHSSN